MRLVVALCLCLAGAAVSGLLLLQHHGESRAVAAVEQVCGEEGGATSDCETVARSPWSTAGGVPLAALGVLFYASLSLLLALTLLLPEERRTTFAGLAILGLSFGLVVDVLLLGVQAFSIGAFCALCILTYALAAAALFALLPAWRGALGLGSGLGAPEGRLVVAGWVLGTVAIGGAVFAGDLALDYREQRRQASLLGTPAPPPAASPTPSPSPSPAPDVSPSEAPSPTPAPASGTEDAAHWERRARELQQTLDDPQKLEQYFAEKARREFESAETVEIDLAGIPRKGPAEAPVQVVEYSDFLCPFCRNLASALTQFVPQAGGRVAVYFKNFPLDQECNPSLPRSIHPGSCKLALGAVCAEYQGKFAAYHNQVFAAEGLVHPTTEDVVRLAGEAGLNADAMRGCLEDPKASADLSAQIEEGLRLKVQATPTVYVNGKKLPRINDFVAVVDREAQRKGFEPLNP
jgi:protein-disulfide isomerase/uncharacterized membrane protein